MKNSFAISFILLLSLNCKTMNRPGPGNSGGISHLSSLSTLEGMQAENMETTIEVNNPFTIDYSRINPNNINKSDKFVGHGSNIIYCPATSLRFKFKTETQEINDYVVQLQLRQSIYDANMYFEYGIERVNEKTWKHKTYLAYEGSAVRDITEDSTHISFTVDFPDFIKCGDVSAVAVYSGYKGPDIPKSGGFSVSIPENPSPPEPLNYSEFKSIFYTGSFYMSKRLEGGQYFVTETDSILRNHFVISDFDMKLIASSFLDKNLLDEFSQCKDANRDGNLSINAYGQWYSSNLSCKSRAHSIYDKIIKDLEWKYIEDCHIAWPLCITISPSGNQVIGRHPKLRNP